MPIRAEVEGVGVLEFPDGTSPAVIQATVQKVVGDKSMTLKQGGNPLNQLGNVQRGAVDVIGGGAQLLARGANALGLVPESTGNSFFAGPKEVEAQNAQARQNIDQGPFGPAAPGFSPVRAASAGLLTLPLTPTRFLQAPTAVERAFGAGKAGGIAAAAQEVQDPQSGKDFWTRKAAQVGAGVASSAAIQPVAEKAVSLITSGINTLADKAIAGARNLSGANSTEKLVSLTRESLKKSGIDFDSLDEAVKQGLLEDVQKALDGYSGVEPGAIARQAAFRQEKFDPLRHWISRDPAEFTQLENLSHQPVGDPLKQRKADLDKFVLERLNGMRGNQPMPSDVGAAGIRDLKGVLDQEQGKTNVLYRTFQEIAPNVKGEPQRFVNDLFNGLEGDMASASLPAGLRNIVNKISAGEIPLTPSTLYQLQKMANGARGSDGSANYALGHLSRAIDREMEAISGSIGALDRSMPVVPGTTVPGKEGAQAADVLKMARGQHAKVMGELEGSKTLSSVDEGKAVPENFTDNLLRAPLRELAASWMKLGNDAKQGIRAQVVDELRTKAFGGASDEAGKAANQATFNNYLSDPTTQQKLRVILGEKGLQEVKRLGLMLESAHMQPSGSAVNNSKTGGAILGAFSRGAEAMKSKGIPGGSFLQDSARRGAVDTTMSMSPDALGKQSLVIDPLVEEILKRRVGHYSGLLGGVSAYSGLGLLGME